MQQNSKNNVSKAQSENHKRILTQLMRHDDNRKCADCNARGPTWASVNLGVFVCLNCSGIHRNQGVHISKVRSTNLDTWLPEQVAFVQAMGNRKANLFWEGRMPEGVRRPQEGDMMALNRFIGDKYRDQAYALRGFDQPPTIENYTTHPFMKQFSEAESAPEGDAEQAVKQQEVPRVASSAGRHPSLLMFFHLPLSFSLPLMTTSDCLSD